MRKKALIIRLSIILFIAAAAAIGVLSYSSFLTVLSEEAAQPDELLLQGFSCIEDRRYEELYDMLSEQSQATVLMADFIVRNEKICGGIEATNISVSVTGRFAPEEKPEFLEITMIEDVKGRGGSHYVVPKVKTLFENRGE